MQYELYIDVFFLINAIMDWMLLKITGKILSCKVGKMRILWGAFLGRLNSLDVTAVVQKEIRNMQNPSGACGAEL